MKYSGHIGVFVYLIYRKEVFFFAEDHAHHIAPQGFVLNTNVDHQIFLLARLSMESQRKRHSISTCHKIEIILTPSLINAYYEPQLKSSTH